MRRRLAVVLCLLLSGLAALVYQIIWVRLLGLSFGTTTAAIGTVLAVFFTGMAIGNTLAARFVHRVRHPLRWYAALELGIGAFALASLPALRNLHAVYAWTGVDHGATALTAIRIAAAAVLLPPTIAMGATLPVVARGLVQEDGTLGRWSAILYAANTAGAVLGAYLCGFWLIPALGLTRSVLLAGAANLAVASAVFAVGGRLCVTLESAPAAGARTPGANDRGRGVFLALFGVSGFAAIGYEIVWSKVFGIVMEGTLYGFATVLSAFLFGISAGSLAVAPFADRLRNLPRAFALCHAGIAVSVAAGMLSVPYLPYAHRQLAEAMGTAGGIHLLFALVAPVVLLPTALFGAAFPILIRITTRRARGVGAGIGVATAVNTAGSIAASLLIGFWAIPALGMDATLYALVLLDLGIAVLVLLVLQERRGPARIASSAAAAAVLSAVALSFSGVHVERAIAGRGLEAESLAQYRGELDRRRESLSLVIEGKSSIVTVAENRTGRDLRTDGLPESSLRYAPPYYALDTVLVGVLPYLFARAPERALVIGLGGGNTLTALGHTRVRRIDVIELEEGVVEAVGRLQRGRTNPLDDPRVALRIADGRNELLLRRYRDAQRYDIIASQPSHPWRSGAAQLFTEEFFALARENLTPGGVAAVWVNGFRTDAESLLAVVASFEAVFPGSLLIDGSEDATRDSLLLLGSDRPIRLDVAQVARRLAEPRLRRLLGLFGLRSVPELLAHCEGPAAAFAALASGASNTDDNAFVETRIPERFDWSGLDFGRIEARLPADAPVLPPRSGALDVAAVARALLARPAGGVGWPLFAKLDRLLRVHGADLEPFRTRLLRAEGMLRTRATEQQGLSALQHLAERHPSRPEPLRALGLHLAQARREFGLAARAFADAYALSSAPTDAYDAGRALYHVDPQAAWAWFERIPPSARPHFPRLALYTAEQRLDAGERGSGIRDAYAALRRYRDTEEGRAFPGIDELLARVADAAGDAEGARTFRASARGARETRGEDLLDRARAHREAGRLVRAAEALERAGPLLPADSRVDELRAELALARGDRKSLEAALRSLRRWAPSLREAVAAENRFRAEHGLPMLPERSAQDLSPSRL